MKKLLAMLCLLFATSARQAAAEIKPAALQSKTVLTERALLLTQVDILSLFFSSPAVAYVPKLVGEGRVEIEAAVLDPTLIADHDRLYRLVTRQVSVFSGQLLARLGLYAPAVAQHFDPDADLRFTIVEGPQRLPVAVWEGEWRWVSSGSVARQGSKIADDERIYTSLVKRVVPKKPTRVSERERKWLSCPAMRNDS